MSITIHPKIRDSAFLWGDPERLRAWLDVLLMAAPRLTQRVVGRTTVSLDRGEFLASIRFLAERWKWSKSRVETFLGALETGGQIGTGTRTEAGTTYRVVNYDTYNVSEPFPGQQQGQQQGQSIRQKVLENKNTPVEISSLSSWVSQFQQQAVAAGFHWPDEWLAKDLGPHVVTHGEAIALRAWHAYLRGRPYLDYDRKLNAGAQNLGAPEPDIRFVSPRDCGRNFGYWLDQTTPAVAPPAKLNPHLQATE